MWYVTTISVWKESNDKSDFNHFFLSAASKKLPYSTLFRVEEVELSRGTTYVRSERFIKQSLRTQPPVLDFAFQPYSIDKNENAVL